MACARRANSARKTAVGSGPSVGPGGQSHTLRQVIKAVFCATFLADCRIKKTPLKVFESGAAYNATKRHLLPPTFHQLRQRSSNNISGQTQFRVEGTCDRDLPPHSPDQSQVFRLISHSYFPMELLRRQGNASYSFRPPRSQGRGPRRPSPIPVPPSSLSSTGTAPSDSTEPAQSAHT